MCHKGSGAAIMICILRFWSLNIQEKQAAVKKIQCLPRQMSEV
jgi:hypothetical protein